MDPTPFSQKLCALRDNGPSFLGECNRPRNNSHSPQPPIRKRLYSEDINSILQEAPASGVPVFERRKTYHVGESQVQGDSAHHVFEEPKIFLEELGHQRPKQKMFGENLEKLEEVNRSIGDIMDFDRNLRHLQEESENEESADISFLHEELGKQNDKQINHFEVIFDSGVKNKRERGFLGKRDEFDNLKSSCKGGIKKIGGQSERRNHLKVEEHIAYVFKSTKVNLSVGLKEKQNNPIKKVEIKMCNKRNRGSLNKGSQKKKESGIALERKAFQIQG